MIYQQRVSERRKAKDLKSHLKSDQAIFNKLAKLSKGATFLSFNVTHIMIKHRKPFEDVMKEHFWNGEEFKNKPDNIFDINSSDCH